MSWKSEAHGLWDVFGKDYHNREKREVDYTKLEDILSILNKIFLKCGPFCWSVVRVFCGFLCSPRFLFSVTLPGTNAPRSAVTRGKPSLFWFFFLASRAL